MRLIDVDAFLEKMKRTSRYFDVKFDIEEMPTIDAVPVVRCKDCEHFRTNDENVPYCLNPFGLDDPEPNGFCNYGIGKN